MDPNANLAEQLALAKEIQELNDKDESDWRYVTKAIRLAELVLALDEWLSKGGIRPRTWIRPFPKQ